MRLSRPRVPPLTDAEMSPEQRELLEPFLRDGRADNVFATLARHPALFRRWLVFATHVLQKSSLGLREREIVILRMGWLCDSGYERAQHAVLARRAGLSETELGWVEIGSAAPWPERDKALLRAAEELHRDCFVSDETWAMLSRHFTLEQIYDVVFAAGQYTLVSMALNTLGVQIDPYLAAPRPSAT